MTTAKSIRPDPPIAPSVLKQLRGQMMALLSEWGAGISRRWQLEDAKKLLDGLEKLTVACEQAGVRDYLRAAAEISANLFTFVNSSLVPNQTEMANLEMLFARLRQEALSDPSIAKPINKVSVDESADKPLLAFIISDQDLAANGFSEQMATRGFSCMYFANVAAALEQMQKRWPDLVLVDDASLTGLHDLVTKTERLAGGGTQRVLFVAMIDVKQDLRVRFAMRAGADAVVNIAAPKAVATVLSLEYKRFLQQAYRVLVLDDDPLTLLLCQVILETRGIRVFTTQDPGRVLTDIADFKPDLILLDLYMPDTNGIDVAQFIRGRSEFETIPVVFLSGERDDAKRFSALRAGGDEFLFKPIQARDLIGSVESRIRRARVLVQRGNAGKLRERRGRLIARAAFIEETLKYRAARTGQATALVLLSLNRLQELLPHHGFVDSDHLLRQFVDLVAAEQELAPLCAAGEGCVLAVVHADDASGLKAKLKAILKRLDTGLKPLSRGAQTLTCTLAATRLASQPLENAIRQLFELAESRHNNRVSALELELSDQVLDAADVQQQSLRRLLLSAVNRDAFRFEFMPLIPLKGQISGQYLIRSFCKKQLTRRAEEWTENEAADFAAQLGLLTRLDRARLHRILLDLSRDTERPDEIRLHIPISAENLFDDSFAPWLAAELAGLGVDGSEIVLQFDVEQLRAVKRLPLLELQAIQILGVRIGLAGVGAQAEQIKLARLGPIESVVFNDLGVDAAADARVQRANAIMDLLKIGKFVVARTEVGYQEIPELHKLGVHYLVSSQLTSWQLQPNFDFKSLVF